MARSPLDEIEELTLCPCCRRPFDEDEHVPKILDCLHHCCLRCARNVLVPDRKIYCVQCWKYTSLPGGQVETLPTYTTLLVLSRHLDPDLDLACTEHAQPALWCLSCSVRACRTCPDHSSHTLRSPAEARAMLRAEARELRADLQRLAVRQRDLLLRALDATTALKLRLENELAAPPLDHYPAAEVCSLRACATERDKLKVRQAEALVRARVDDLVRSAPTPLDFNSFSRAFKITQTWAASPAPGPGDPLVLLANYCLAQLWARTTHGRLQDEGCETASAEKAGGGFPAVRAPTPLPLFYFELEVDGLPFGRIVIEVREDVAPRMARNFAALTTCESGAGYRGCAVFQCWENESVITGDFEHNNGSGGRSAFEETYFMPDETPLAAVRGAVGMRRSQKRHDNQGLVASQFRIVLREMRGFTAIFAAVVEGLELVDRLSCKGDSAGKPTSTILISACGKLN